MAPELSVCPGFKSKYSEANSAICQHCNGKKVANTKTMADHLTKVHDVRKPEVPNQPLITDLVKPQHSGDVKRYLALAIGTSTAANSFLDNQFFREALNLLGGPTISRHDVTRTIASEAASLKTSLKEMVAKVFFYFLFKIF